MNRKFGIELECLRNSGLDDAVVLQKIKMSDLTQFSATNSILET